MKREYFGMLFIITCAVLLIAADSFFGDEKVTDCLSTYIVLVVMTAYYAGQYSMRFPKRF